eukprot:EG_transcript_11548
MGKRRVRKRPLVLWIFAGGLLWMLLSHSFRAAILLPNPTVQHSPAARPLYLTYQPSGGLSNQLQSILHALHVATVLQRTLVLPHFLDGQQGTQRLRPLPSVVDLPRLRSHAAVPLVAMDDFLAAGGGRVLDCLLVEVHKPDEGLKRSFLPSGTGASYHYFRRLGLANETASPAIRSVSFPEGGFQSADLMEKFGALPYGSASLLALTYMYYITDLRGMAPGLQHAVRFAAAQQDVAEDVMQKLGGPGQYDCLHLRRGDFLQYCEFLVEERDITAAEKPNVCAPPLPCLGRRLAAHFLAHSPVSRPLYISTNARPAELQGGLAPHLAGRRWASLAAYQPALRKSNSTLASAVDMLVCQGASQFIGNVYSSFSLRIRLLRNALPSRFLGDRQECLAHHFPGSVGYWRTLLTSYVPPLCLPSESDHTVVPQRTSVQAL